MEKWRNTRTLLADGILLLTTVLSAAGLVLLPQEIWIPGEWAGDFALWLSKYHALLCAYICMLCGLWLWSRLCTRFSDASRRMYGLAYAVGAGLSCSGLLLNLFFLTGNPLTLHMEGLGIGILVLWPWIHGVLQLFLCLKARPLWAKFIPVGIVLLEGLFTLWVYFDPLEQSSGWDELAALIVGVFAAGAAGAVLAAWILFGIICRVRQKKASAGNGLMPSDESEN